MNDPGAIGVLGLTLLVSSKSRNISSAEDDINTGDIISTSLIGRGGTESVSPWRVVYGDSNARGLASSWGLLHSSAAILQYHSPSGTASMPARNYSQGTIGPEYG